MSGVGVGAPGEIDARELSPTIPLDAIVGDPALEEGPANGASLGERTKHAFRERPITNRTLIKRAAHK